jgi:hypothetical protein
MVTASHLKVLRNKLKHISTNIFELISRSITQNEIVSQICVISREKKGKKEGRQLAKGENKEQKTYHRHKNKTNTNMN